MRLVTHGADLPMAKMHSRGFVRKWHAQEYIPSMPSSGAAPHLSSASKALRVSRYAFPVCYDQAMSKQIKYVVAVVLKNKSNPEEFLVVKRPDDDPDLGGHWGFPAATMKPGELPEQAAKRICREKLNCDAEATRFLGLMFQKRNSYDIFLMDVDMMLAEGQQPDVHAATTENTAYVDQKWSTDPMDLMSSAKGGSCCSSIFLTDRGLLDREEWINSLEGSDKVG